MPVQPSQYRLKLGEGGTGAEPKEARLRERIEELIEQNTRLLDLLSGRMNGEFR